MERSGETQVAMPSSLVLPGSAPRGPLVDSNEPLVLHSKIYGKCAIDGPESINFMHAAVGAKRPAAALERQSSKRSKHGGDEVPPGTPMYDVAATESITPELEFSRILADCAIAPSALNPSPTDQNAWQGRVLGKGGNGTVYQATYDGNRVAVKMPLFKNGAQSADVQKELNRIRAECVMLYRLHRHANLVNFIGVVNDAKTVAIVMEFMAGGNLHHLLRSKKQVPWPQRMRYLRDAARAMKYLHSRNPPILHRDLKSMNILLHDGYSLEDRAVLCDFGLSTSKSDSHAKVGTKAWMAPELLSRGGKFLPASDVFSFGIVMFEVATRKTPYEGRFESPDMVLKATKQGQRPAISSVVTTDWPPGYLVMMRDCWHQDPRRRPTFEQIFRYFEQTLETFYLPIPASWPAASSQHNSSEVKAISGETTEANPILEAAGLTGAPTLDLSLANELPPTVVALRNEGRRRFPENADLAVELWTEAARAGDPVCNRFMGALHHDGTYAVKNQVTAMHLLQEAANQRDTKAQYILGTLYEQPNSEWTDLAKAVDWYTRAARGKHVQAMVNLGGMYHDGRGVIQDFSAARNWWSQAGDDPVALCRLGLLYHNGSGVPRNDEKAAQLWRLSAEQGFPMAQHNLGVLYTNGQGVPADFEKAVAYYRQAALQGHVPAQFSLGNSYFIGRGVPKDRQVAALLWEQAASRGHANAQRNLGSMYKYGLGVKTDLVRARSLYQAAADQGLAAAQCDLGMMFENGEGMERKDPVTAAKWYSKAVDQNYAAAQAMLAQLLYRGEGVPRDPVRALSLWHKAIAQGNYAAQRMLADLYMVGGEGIIQDRYKAREFYLKAASQGDAETQYKLGMHLKQGTGDGIFPANLQCAAAFFRQAADQGHDLAKKALEALPGEYNPYLPNEKDREALQNADRERIQWFQRLAADRPHMRSHRPGASPGTQPSPTAYGMPRPIDDHNKNSVYQPPVNYVPNSHMHAMQPMPHGSGQVYSVNVPASSIPMPRNTDDGYYPNANNKHIIKQ